ncbi:hypothetical protein HPP92_001248 [Vanilla planifolia]|uniref:Uncharacterized protein n=1 Tax=Vanilla planifolia TaxID=51239 RepID=A0A835S300_VANPL|nr:hypothetical protein HPP92_001248 [Vanilla planifolia]
MEIRDVDELAVLLDSCISRVKWRLRPSAKRRLETDILALCSGLRAVVMVDYGGRMPVLQDHLCGLICLMRKESSMLLHLRIMVIEDMIYIVHVAGLTELSNLSLQQQLHFVDLEVDPPQLLQTSLMYSQSEFRRVQQLFSSIFSSDAVVDPSHNATPPSIMPKSELIEYKAVNVTCVADSAASQQFEIFDLSNCLRDTQITIPSLNGWLLGYPVVYLFRKENAANAMYNLSTKYLHIYKIIISRQRMPNRKDSEEELMSFSVPYALSLAGDKEFWAEAFLARLQAKLEACKQVWSRIRLEVTECHPQAIVL